MSQHDTRTNTSSASNTSQAKLYFVKSNKPNSALLVRSLRRRDETRLTDTTRRCPGNRETDNAVTLQRRDYAPCCASTAMQLLCTGYILRCGVRIPVCSTDICVHTLTFDLGGEVGGVTGDKELQLLMEVTAREVDVP